jgi:hypothetical protein
MYDPKVNTEEKKLSDIEVNLKKKLNQFSDLKDEILKILCEAMYTHINATVLGKKIQYIEELKSKKEAAALEILKMKQNINAEFQMKMLGRNKRKFFLFLIIFL